MRMVSKTKKAKAKPEAMAKAKPEKQAKPLPTAFDACLEAIQAGNYATKTFHNKLKATESVPLEKEQAIEQTVNFLLYIAAQKDKDSRFRDIYDHVLIPDVPKSIKDIVKNCSPTEIMEFISPGSEGF